MRYFWKKKGKTIFHKWIIKDLRSQLKILLKNKVIINILCKSENTDRSLVTNKY